MTPRVRSRRKVATPAREGPVYRLELAPQPDPEIRKRALEDLLGWLDSVGRGSEGP